MFTFNRTLPLLSMTVAISLSACGTGDVVDDDPRFVDDAFPHRGAYTWTFLLMGTTQISTHLFDEDHIDYEMEGAVYATEYTMERLSFDAEEGRWVGHDNGQHYVMFIRPQANDTLSIYKHKAADLDDAIDFPMPADDATADHGWNIYRLDGDPAVEELLPFDGHYVGDDGTDIQLDDDAMVIDDATFAKLSYHAGERRWVGEGDGDTFVVVFLGTSEPADTLDMAVEVFDDMEAAYRVKYDESEAWQTYARRP